ncbi:MAG: ABC transporter ATP-binding protein/permease [Holosporales bacterium]|nr:ABC transporter ATP-binding protein/permease [Holosporales bacterium]
MIFAILFCVLASSLDAVIIWSLKPYTDIVMVEKSIATVWSISFAIIIFSAIQGVCNYFAAYLNAWVGGKITSDLKFKLYKKLLAFETAYFDKHYSGDVIFRFDKDADTASVNLLKKFRVIISRIASTISLIFVLIINSWKLACIAIVIFAISFLPIANIRRSIRAAIKGTVAANSKMLTIYNESVSGNKTIALYNLSQNQEGKIRRILANLFHLNIKMVQRASWLSPMMHVVISVGVALSIVYGSHLIITNQITSGNFVSFIVAVLALYNPIKNLGNSIKDFQLSITAVERVMEILDTEPKIKEKPDATVLTGIRSDISFEKVTFGYAEKTAVLNNFTLKIKKGETIAFVGGSGGGKTTIVNLLPRFYDVNSGAIKIDGIDIRDYTLVSLRNNLSAVFQDNFLFSGTIKENITIGKSNATDAEIQDAVKMAYLDKFVSTLKKGINTEIGERGIRLSGGQKQRVAIARAFIKNAPIVILDEATSALDNKSEAIVQKAINNLMTDKTVFVIAHRLSTIKNADKIAVIDKGTLLEIGTHEELMKSKSGKYKELYEMQFSKRSKS